MKGSQRRSNIEIITDILKVGENGVGKIRTMYGANLSYSQIQEYLGFLVGQGFVDKADVGNPAVTYKVTNSGFEVLNTIKSIIDVFSLDDNDGFWWCNSCGLRM
jgi:predicted transcriptional regulator